MNRPNPGTFRWLVTIEQLSGTQDASGQPVKTWSTFAQAWASIESLTGNERVVAQQIYAESNIRMWTYYQDGIQPAMRVSYGTRHFDITDVSDPWGDRRYLALTCIERTEAGS